MTRPPYEAPEFLEVATAQHTTYVPFQEAISNPDIAAHVTATALSEADQWLQRYAAFFDRIGGREGMEIVQAIEGVKRQLGGHWPGQATLPGDDAGLLPADEDG